VADPADPAGDYIRAVPGEWVVRNPDSFWGFGHDVFPAETFAATYEPAGAEKAPAVPPPPVAAVLDREALGRIVHETRCAENAKRDRPFRLEPWDRRAPSQQELDMKIAESVAAALRGSYVHAACDAQVERLQARARAAEATLAALRTVLLEGGQDDGTVRRRALAIISSEGEPEAAEQSLSGRRVAVMLLHDPDSGEVVDVAVYEDDIKAESEAQPTADDSGFRVRVWGSRPYIRGTLGGEEGAADA